MAQRILIIEDELDVNRLLEQVLQENGYETVSEFNGLDGVRKFLEEPFDMVLLDLMLPYKSGDQVLKEIRNVSNVPVLVISAKGMTGTKIDLLMLGADDYITKPFDLDEVVARVYSHLRRHAVSDTEGKITYKELSLDREEKVIKLDGKELDLTAKEYQMLELFMRCPNKVFSKSNLYESIWEEEYLGDDSVIKTHISNLRTKLKKAGVKTEYIETVWGLGYRLAK